MALFRRSAQPAPAAVSRRVMSPAWDPNRPLPTPSNEWVDADVKPTSPRSADPLLVDKANGGESGMNIRKLT